MTEPDPELDAPSSPPSTSAPATGEAGAAGLAPSRMRGTEMLYGYVVALELLVVAILNLAITHGKGAPTHPATTLAAGGVLAAVALAGLLQTKNRFIAGFGAIVAAFVVTLPKTPDSIALYHVFGLVFPIVYALLLTQRQRKAALAQAKAGQRPARMTRSQRRAEADNSRGGRRAPADTRRGRGATARTPSPSRVTSGRYTPPKPKRRRPQPQKDKKR